MIGFRRAPSALRLRLHHMFLDAPVPVVQAVADYAGRGRSQAGRVLDEFIKREQPRIRQERDASDERFSPEGRFFHLEQTRDALNERFFQGGVCVHGRVCIDCFRALEKLVVVWIARCRHRSRRGETRVPRRGG